MGTFQIDFGEEPPLIVGIDLGTTNSLVAYLNAGLPEIIPGADGDPLVPSVVSVANGTLVGNPARAALLTSPAETVYSVKRLMGRGVEDIAGELKLFPFKIAPGSESVIRLQLGDKAYTPPEISAFILQQLKTNAEAHLGKPVSKADAYNFEYKTGAKGEWRPMPLREVSPTSAPGRPSITPLR